METNRNSDIPAVAAFGLGRRFGRHWAVAHCDLEVPSGQTLLIAGPNGSGKSTFLRLCSGLLKPNRGEVRIFDLNPQSERLETRRRLSLVGHDNYLYNQLTALETLKVWAGLRGSALDRAALVELLQEVDLAEWADTLVVGFSAGMKKRLTLLRTKIEQPDLILLDEPFSALDPSGQDLVKQWIRSFQQQGKTVVIASHNLPRVTPLCHRAIYLKKGQIVWSGSPNELLSGFEGKS
ncbi:MAG: heme ABC exporter ATP-binding protein CcmA [Acidobacteriota bacterium]